MKISFDDIDAAQQVLTGLDDAEIDKFWTYLDTATFENISGAAPFFGATLLSFPCDKDADQNLFLKGVVPDLIRQELQDLSQAGALAGRGTTTALRLYLYWGPDIGSGQFFVTDRQAMRDLLADLFPQAQLTEGEAAVVMDLLVGHDLRHTSRRDGLSYETKRTLLKRALQKTELGKQGDLVSRVLGAFLLAASEAHSHTPQTDLFVFRNWQKQCFCDGLQAYTLFDDIGEMHHILEAGAKGGHPVVALMPSFFPYFTASQIALLEKLNLRLLMPLRRGAMMPSLKTQTVDELQASTLRGAQLALDLHGAQNVAVLGVSNAAGYAATFAALAPERISQLVIASPLLSAADGDRHIDRLRAGFSRLSYRAPLLRSRALQYLQRAITSQDRFHRLMMTVASTLPSERDVVTREYDDPAALRFYHIFVQNSLALFLVDTHPDLAITRSMLQPVSQPIALIRGADDTVNPKALVDACFADQPNVSEHILPDTGHVFRLEKMDGFFTALARIVRD